MYYAEFQILVSDADWNQTAQKNTLKQGAFKVLKDSLQHWNITGDWTECAMLDYNQNAHFHARAAKRKFGR